MRRLRHGAGRWGSTFQEEDRTMSLVSTYVESKEGHWYQNPVIEEDGWFICWDDDEPIELVIAEEFGTNPQTVLTPLHNKGWRLQIISKGGTAGRLFKGKFKQARSYFLVQTANGPTDEILKGNTQLKYKPEGQGVYYTNSRNGNGGAA
jgi:hypothetical protein